MVCISNSFLVDVEDLAPWLKLVYWSDYNLHSMVDSEVAAGTSLEAISLQVPHKA